MTFIYLSLKSELTMERWQNMLEREIYQESLIRVVVDEVHCVTDWSSSSNNEIIQLFVPFVCRIFATLAILIMPF